VSLAAAATRSHTAALRLAADDLALAAGIRTCGDFDGVRQAKRGDKKNEKGDVALHIRQSRQATLERISGDVSEFGAPSGSREL
jgi:hypothetical protein